MQLIDWQALIQHSPYDPIAGIRISKLLGNDDFSSYLTVIDPGHGVNPHYHSHGDEHYHIVSGKGEITLTDRQTGQQQQAIVLAQHSFNVPSDTLHSLRNTGTEPLVLMFSCPASHLGDDRFTL